MMVITGRNSLAGSVRISGSKNETLSIIPLSLCTDGDFRLTNVPSILDVQRLIKMLEVCGKKVIQRGDHEICIRGTVNPYIDFTATDDFQLIRASLYCLGPLLSRKCVVRFPTPGGCPIGDRPIDLHMKLFRSLGIEVNLEGDATTVDSSGGLRCESVRLEFPSVGATLNAVSAATGCDGLTKISNIALEPEVIRYVDALCEIGADITMAGPRELAIVGNQDEFNSTCEMRVSPDRIEAGTFLAAGLACGGDLRLQEFPIADMGEPVRIAEIMGAELNSGADTTEIEFPTRCLAADISADVYPCFPTDLQPIFAAALCSSSGIAHVRDRVFPLRFQYAVQLRSLGADIAATDGDGIVIAGKNELLGSNMTATDIRGSAAMIIGALSAHGTSTIAGEEVLYRGYEAFAEKMNRVGADIRTE